MEMCGCYEQCRSLCRGISFVTFIEGNLLVAYIIKVHVTDLDELSSISPFVALHALKRALNDQSIQSSSVF